MKEHTSVTDTTLLASASGFGRRPASFDGFVHARDARLFDGSGRELLLRGVGLGNWMLPEGYMWRFGPGAESPREIEALVDRLLGADAAARFWDAFRTPSSPRRTSRASPRAGSTTCGFRSTRGDPG